MPLRWRRVIWSIAAVFVCVVAARVYLGPVRTQGPVGACIAGDLDLNDPAPFTRARLGGTIVGLAASGGGSRAAYFEAAILREVRRAGAGLSIGEGAEVRDGLLGQIDIISSVSGGSLAASYFALNAARLQTADAGSPDWTTFLDAMAVPYRTRQWFGAHAWNPVNWARAVFTDYNRGVLARDDYDAALFHGAHLADLPNRPALYLNAFDVANHVRFVLSKHYIETTYFQPKHWWGKLSEPQTLLAANDLSFVQIDPASVRLADAVYASSAFPLAYPNLPLRHCGQKILFQGRQIFLADGALADNSGLITLLTQLRTALDPGTKGNAIVAIYIDASVDRLDANGTKFQQMGIEDDYAWRNTVFGHGVESIFGAVALIQDLGWKLVESTGVVTDQLSMNWPMDLTDRKAPCVPPDKTSWTHLHQTGALSLRPLVIRLGLRDVLHPDFDARYGRDLAGRSELADLLRKAGVANGISQSSKELSQRLQVIPTDFTLTAGDRALLDLAAFLLVHGKLSDDLAQWNEVYRTVSTAPLDANVCAE